MLHVLHVEDEALMLLAVKEGLTRSGEFSVEAANTLAEAKDLLAKAPKYDVLLVDLGLPDSSGITTVKELAKYGIPIIVLSGSPCEDCITQAAAAGAEDYMVKTGFSLDRLIWRIKFVIKRREAAARADKKNSKARKISSDTFEAVRPFLCAGL